MDERERRRLSQLMEPGQAISKKSYIFDGKRQFNNVRRYKVAYTSGLSLENIKTMLKDALAPKGKKPVRARPPINYKSVLFGALKIVVPIFIFLGFCLMVLMALAPNRPATVPNPPNYTMNYSYKFINTEVISYRNNVRAYATMGFNETGVNKTEIMLRLYSEPIPREIVLLKSRKYEPDNFEDFKANLSSMLEGSGLKLNEMDITQLMHLPSNAPMIIIVPTGRVPSSFLGLDDPKFDLKKLMEDNGAVIIYIGYRFGSGAIAENGSVLGVNEASPEITKLKIQFRDLLDVTLKDGFRMVKAGYATEGGEHFYFLHNGISVVAGKNNGYFVTFPNGLKDGWKGGGADAAHDIYSVIRNLTWLSQRTFAEPRAFGNPDKEKNVYQIETLFSAPYLERNNLTAQFVLNFLGFDGRSQTKIEYTEFPITAKGTLSHVDWILPTDICNRTDGDSCEVYMTIDFKESFSRDEQMRIAVYRDGNRVYWKPIGIKKTQLPGEKLSFYVDLPSGDYVLKVEDETGYVYAQSYLHIPKIELREAGFNFFNGGFSFIVLADGEKLREEFEVKNIYISLDGQQNQSLSSQFSKTDGQHRVYYRFIGAIPEGDHKIIVTVGKETVIINRNFFRKREYWENPMYQGAFVVVIVLFAIGMLIKRPESVVFQVDVPDFPPLSKTKVPISREQVCQIFELVNSDYRWKNMPLKQGEIKNGFRKLSYKGRPILVSDYNLERVLDQLVEEGLAKKSEEFYGLASWEASSGKSLRYLSVFRSLRDTFLNMTIHFTDLGERADCDMLVSAHDKYYVHIYTGEGTIPRALATLSKGKTVIVFKNSDSVDDFVRTLSSTSKSMIAAKLYIDNETLFASTPGEMEKIIK
ncbi:MAG: hypothetical protein V1909_01450 [Candidatus Micrarchaeota archaeon]